MADIDKTAIAVALTIGAGMLALLFAGQVWSYAARWVGRSIAGAVQILLAAGIAYTVYQVYTGWRAADDSTTDEYESSVELSDELDATDDYLAGDLSDEEFEQEVEQELEKISD